MSYGVGYGTTGRTNSTSSIYDYPEHLNPFYEDENHKRLRFWNFGSKRYDKPRSERRGSLVSIRDGLRNMWEFKTLRPMKKRSSSLGINKTSESPPPLRRDDPDVHYHTINSSLSSPYRNTLNSTVSGYHTGYSQSTSNTPLFARNSRERSSLQAPTVGMRNEIGFHRNDHYRSTFANGSATYGGRSMITSTPRSRYGGGATEHRMTTGVSQSSLKSTNPFDDEGMDDSISLNDSFNTANGTFPRRKKRRAPPPPVRNIANISVDPSDTALATSLRIEETPPQENQEDVNNLSNLTAEIESFVRTNSNDKVNRENTGPASRVEETPTPSDSNNNHVQELVIIERKTEIVEKVSPTPKDVKKRLELKVEVEKTTSMETDRGNADIPEPVEQMSQLEDSKLEEEPRPITPPQPIPRFKPTPPPIPQTPPIVEPVDLENVDLPETPVPARRLNKNRNQDPANGTELRITESSDSATTSTAEEEENMEFKAAKPINYEFKYKVEPIKTEIDEKISTARLKISESTGDIESLQNPSTERRRSVRDIIESINKSQSLLKVNHESSGTLYSAQSNDSVNRNLRELNDREKEIQRMLREMETNYSGNGQPQPRKWSLTPPSKHRSSYYDNVPEGDENLDNLDDRNNLLSKSALRSKKSPTKSLGIEQNDNVQFQDCIDWNPLPKPRRSRHFADTQVNQSTSGTGDVLTVIDQNNNSNGQQS